MNTLDFIKNKRLACIAEIGIAEGNTSEQLAASLPVGGTLHLFDFGPKVRQVLSRLNSQGYTNVVGHANTAKPNDSYNWSMMRLLQKHTCPVFDYVYLDGAHTWQVDALCFFLTDKLLKVGGYFDFDDYYWSMAKSPTQNPQMRPKTAQDFTAEQIREYHVALIVDLLVRREPRYEEVVPNKIFRKLA